MQLFCVAATMAMTSCSSSGGRYHLPAAISTSSAAPIVTLHQSWVPDPPFGPGYRTTGSYPQVSGIPGLDAVNAALRNLITADQDRARQDFKAYGAPDPQYTGLYSDDIAQSRLSTSSAVVSVMIDTLSLYPGGNDGQGWASITLLVPSTKVVALADLFNNPTEALTTISALAWSALIVANRCTPEVLQPSDGTIPDYLAPTMTNYQQFAMTPAGLSFGFPEYGACAYQTATISWDKIASFLSPEGKLLVSELR